MPRRRGAGRPSGSQIAGSEHARTAVRSRGRWLPTWSIIVTGVLAGAFAFAFDFRLVVPLAMGLPLAFVALRLGSADGIAGVPAQAGHPAAWMGPAWAMLFLAPELRIFSWASNRSTSAVIRGDLSPDILIELLVGFGVLALLFRVLLRGWEAPPPGLAWIVAAFPVFAAASTVWSELPLVTGGRAVQYLALAGLLLYTAGWAQRDPESTAVALDGGIRLLIFGLLLLVAWGVVTPNWWDGRFAWPGTHPIVATTMLGAALILLLASGRRARLTAPIPWWIVVAVLAYAIVEMQSRGPLAAVVVGAIAALAVRYRDDLRVLFTAGSLGLMVATTLLAFFTASLITYALRGKPIEAFWSLSGRRDLWIHVLENPVGSEIWGIGIGANRTSMLAHASFAGNAHNMWLDLLQNVGVLGMGLAAAAILAVAAAGLRTSQAAAVGLAAFLFVAASTMPAYGQPGATATALLLAAAMTSLGGHRRPRVAEPALAA